MSEGKSPGKRWSDLGSVAGGLAHEIKNPLSTMTINLDLLREDLEGAHPDTERALRRVQTMESEVERLEGILHDFLEFAGRLPLEIRDVDLNVVVSEVIDFVAPAAYRKGLELRSHLAEDLPPVPCDRDRVKQALLNLVLNAQDAMGDRGELLIQTSHHGGAVRIDVTDTGPGIPQELLSRIWEAYYSTKRKGTGLGLPIARRIVEAHGGVLEVWTDEGKGTRFTLWFPLNWSDRDAAKENDA